MGHRCLYIAPRDAAATSVPGLETLLYPCLLYTSHVRRAEVELRTIAVEKRGVAAALFLGQHVHLLSLIHI